jgi:hypothetical protein
MLRSWLRVLQWWWSGDHQYLKDLGGTRLEYATHVAMQPPARTSTSVSDVSAGESAAQAEAPAEMDPHCLAQWNAVDGEYDPRCCRWPKACSPYPQPGRAAAIAAEKAKSYEITEEGSAYLHPDFIGTLCHLHDQKHAAYGHSWKKRGEMLGIMANIARKVDRLGGAETDDETSADTAGDLLVYLAKYQSFLFDLRNDTSHSDGTAWANKYLRELDQQMPWTPVSAERRVLLEERLIKDFDRLEAMVSSQDPSRGRLINSMAVDAYTLARHLWQQTEDRKPGGKANPLCIGCGSAESNHGPGGSRSTCVFVARREHDGDDYRGADRD